MSINFPNSSSAEGTNELSSTPYYGRRFVAEQSFVVSSRWVIAVMFPFYLLFGAVFAAFPLVAYAQFPWDDSTLGSKVLITLFLLLHGLAGVCAMVAAIRACFDPCKLILTRNGMLKLHSLARRRSVTISSITAVDVIKHVDDESSSISFRIEIKSFCGKHVLRRYEPPGEFLQALIAANPSIAVSYTSK